MKKQLLPGLIGPFLAIVLLGLAPSLTAVAQTLSFDYMPQSRVNTTYFDDIYGLKRPALSIIGFDNTDEGYIPAYGLGLKQILELNYNVKDPLVTRVFDEIIEWAHRPQVDPLAFSDIVDRRIQLDENSVILQSRAFEALVSLVLQVNGHDPGLQGLNDPEIALYAFLDAFVGDYGIFYVGENLGDMVDDPVKMGRFINDTARAIDLYLSLENAYEDFGLGTLLPPDAKGGVFYVYGSILNFFDVLLETRALDIYSQEINLPPRLKELYLRILEHIPPGKRVLEEVEPGNWAMKQRLAIGYGSLAMQTVPGYIEAPPVEQLLQKALRSASPSSAELDDRRQHWNFMTYGGKRFWAESPYYLDWSLEQVLPFWHALRANGLTGGTDFPFNDPAFINPLDWLADLVTPDGRLVPLDDGNKTTMRSCGMMRWTETYGDKTLGEKCAWIEMKLEGPARRFDTLPVELAIPRTKSPKKPLGRIGSTEKALVEHQTEQQLVVRTPSAAQDTHYVVLNGEHGKAVDRGEGHEQPDQLQLLYYVEDASYLLDSGYDRAYTVENSFWNHYYDHNVLTVGDGEGGLTAPELLILDVRKASEPTLMGEVDALFLEKFGSVTVMHGEQRLAVEPKVYFKPEYTRDVLVVDGDAPYLIDLNQVEHHIPEAKCESNHYRMNYHANSDELVISDTYHPATDGFLRWNRIDDRNDLYLHAFPMSVEFDLIASNDAGSHFVVTTDEVTESAADVKETIPIQKLTLQNLDRCEPFWSVATIFQPGTESAPMGLRPQLLWSYETEMTQQGWVWARSENSYDVFVVRSAGAGKDAVAFDLMQADASFPDVTLMLPGEARYGFARLEHGAEGWSIDSDYQVHLELLGQANMMIADATLQAEKDALQHVSTLALYEAYPNPFNPATTLRFSLAETSPVRLAVYDLLGREVRLLVDGVREAGTHEVRFDGLDLPSGTYLYRLETPTGHLTKKMLLLK